MAGGPKVVEHLKVRQSSFGKRRTRLAAKRRLSSLRDDDCETSKEEDERAVVKEKVISLLGTFQKKKGAYAEKARASLQLYGLLLRYHELVLLRGENHGSTGLVVLQKLLQDALKEVSRVHVSLSCALSRGKRRGDSKQRLQLEKSRKDLGSVKSNLKKRVGLLLNGGESTCCATVSAPGQPAPPSTLEELRSRCPKFAQGDSRHLCEYRCYFREHEPARKLKEFRDYCEWHCGCGTKGAREMQEGWSSRLEFCKIRGFKVVLVSPLGKAFQTTRKAIEHLGVQMDPMYTNSSLYKRKIAGVGGEVVTFHGPRESPYGLIEELFWEEPWQLLLCCIFLNQTTRNQLDVVLMHFFERWNTPEKLLQARQDEIEGVIAPLGLQRRRTETVLRFTKEFLEKDWTDPLELHGIGEYAKAAYEIFCLGVIRPSPQDHALNWYADLFCRQ